MFSSQESNGAAVYSSFSSVESGEGLSSSQASVPVDEIDSGASSSKLPEADEGSKAVGADSKTQTQTQTLSLEEATTIVPLPSAEKSDAFVDYSATMQDSSIQCMYCAQLQWDATDMNFQHLFPP